jgi:hypothetical protein
VIFTSGRGAALLRGVRVHDNTVMQGFARTSPDGSWIFTQVMQDGRFGQPSGYHHAHGDLTLTHVGEDGTRILSWMYLRRFGHGQSIAIQHAHPGLWIWLEAAAVQDPGGPDAFGTRIARFRWDAGRTITPQSAGVELYDPNPGTSLNAPAITGSLIATQYRDGAGAAAVAVYPLASFLARNYTPLTRIPRPDPPGISQGWGLLPDGVSVIWLTGTRTSSANPPPGNTLLTAYDATGITGQVLVTDAPAMAWREPEGVHVSAGQVCYGFASGQPGAFRANVYCRSATP